MATSTDAMRSHYADFLKGASDWTHFCTLTFREGATSAFAWRCFKRWIYELSTFYPDIHWFAVVEGRGYEDRHIHALLNVPRAPDAKKLQRMWRFGLSRITRYSSLRRGAEYLAKSLSDERDDYDCLLY